jgi:hypothetical protein
MPLQQRRLPAAELSGGPQGGKGGKGMALDEDLVIRSRRRAEAKLTFYTDLAAYSIVNLGLFVLWFLTGGGFPWFLFVVIFWGLGVASHGITLFRHSNYFDRMVDGEYRKLVNRQY